MGARVNSDSVYTGTTFVACMYMYMYLRKDMQGGRHGGEGGGLFGGKARK